MAASAAWHKTKAALQQQELEEWRLLRGEGLGCSARRLGSVATCGVTAGAGGSEGAAPGTAAASSGSAIRAGSTAQHAQQVLPPLAEERELDSSGLEREAAGDEHCCTALPSDAPCRQQLFDCATAEALIAAFADAEVREYLQQQVAALAPPPSGIRSSGAATAVMGNAPAPTPTTALPAGGATTAAPSPCSTARQGLHPCPAAAAGRGSGHGHAAAASGHAPDPVLAAWMVTRCPPDLPVRGYEAPPTRSACRLVAAQEMRR